MPVESPFNHCAGARCGELAAYSSENEQRLTHPTGSDMNQARLDYLAAVSACKEGKGCVFLRGAGVELNDTVYQEGARNA